MSNDGAESLGGVIMNVSWRTTGFTGESAKLFDICNAILELVRLRIDPMDGVALTTPMQCIRLLVAEGKMIHSLYMPAFDLGFLRRRE